MNPAQHALSAGDVADYKRNAILNAIVIEALLATTKSRLEWSAG
jgi:hypothetical protein